MADAITAGRSVLLVGPVGSGKVALARHAAQVLAPMTDAEQRAVTRIHSAAGLHDHRGLITERPFRAPHRATSMTGMVGSLKRPGEVTLAHHGVLHLDEVVAFHPQVVRAMHSALHAGSVVLQRGGPARRVPADAVLIAGTAGCPCGLAFTSLCTCTPQDHDRYARQLDALRGLFDIEILALPEPPTT